MFAVLLAQAAPAQPQQGGSIFGSLALPILLGLFFLVVILPSMRRQKREQAQTLASLKPGVKVVTSGGLVGSIVTAKEGEEFIVLRSAESRVQVLRSSVARVLADDAGEAK